MDNLKRYDQLLEDLGEEAENYEKIINKMHEAKNSQFEEEIDEVEEIAEDENNSNEFSLEIDDSSLDIDDDFSTDDDAPLEINEDFTADEDAIHISDAEEIDEEAEPILPLEEEEEAFSLEDNADFIEDEGLNTNFSNNEPDKEINHYQPDPEDLIVDEIFNKLDTPEYREKREKGLFKPKFSDDDFEELEDEEDFSDVEEEELEYLIGQPQDLAKLHQDLDISSKDLEEEKLPDLDALLKEAETLDKDESSLTEEDLASEDLGDLGSMENEELSLNEENTDEMPLLNLDEEQEPVTNDEVPLSDEIQPENTEEDENLSFDLDNLEEDLSTEENPSLNETTLENDTPEESSDLEDEDNFSLDMDTEAASDDSEELSLDMDEDLELPEKEDLSHLENFMDEEQESDDVQFSLGEEDLDEPFSLEEDSIEPETEGEDLESSENLEEEAEKLIDESQTLLNEDIDETSLNEEIEEDDTIPTLDEEEELPQGIADFNTENEESFSNIEENNDNLENYENWEEELQGIEKEENNESLAIQDNIDIPNDPSEEMISDYDTVEHKEDLSDDSLQKIQNNLSNLPVKLALHLRDMLLADETPAQIKELLTQELTKDFPNEFRLKAVSGFEEAEEQENSKGFLSILKYVSIGLLAVVILSSLYFFIIKPYYRKKHLLESGLRDIKASAARFMQAEEKFRKADPSVKWYNKYAEAYMKKRAYRAAEIKLIGQRDPSYNVLKKGAVDISPDDERTRLNIAKLYQEQKRYDKVLENDSEAKKQYDDSLYYLYNKNPDEFKYLDKIGETYISWSKDLRKAPLKRQKLQNAYSLYFKFYDKEKDSIPALSRIIYLSAKLDSNVNQKMDFITSKDYLNKLSHRSLAQLGLYFTKREQFKHVNNIIKILNHQKTKEPLAYYMMGNYYFHADNLDLAERAFVKGIHFNNYKGTKKVALKDRGLQSQFDNMLGELYVKLAREYSAPTKFNQLKRDKFVKLAKIHFQKAQKNDPYNEMSYYHEGNMYYSFYSDYSKASNNFQQAYNMLKENQKEVPEKLYYHLSNSLYKLGDRQKALKYLTELRSNSSNRIRPVIEYNLGLIYYQQGYLEEAREKFNNVLEYYNEELKGYISHPNPMSIRQNKVLFFTAIINNNLGCVYNAMSIQKNEPTLNRLARAHFFKSIELGHRYNNKDIMSLAKINLDDSIFENNTRYVQNFRVGKRETRLYDFTPKYLEEYE